MFWLRDKKNLDYAFLIWGQVKIFVVHKQQSQIFSRPGQLYSII